MQDHADKHQPSPAMDGAAAVAVWAGEVAEWDIPVVAIREVAVILAAATLAVAEVEVDAAAGEAQAVCQ